MKIYTTVHKSILTKSFLQSSQATKKNQSSKKMQLLCIFNLRVKYETRKCSCDLLEICYKLATISAIANHWFSCSISGNREVHVMSSSSWNQMLSVPFINLAKGNYCSIRSMQLGQWIYFCKLPFSMHCIMFGFDFSPSLLFIHFLKWGINFVRLIK